MDNAPKMMDNPPMAVCSPGNSFPARKRASGFPGQRLVVVHPPQLARASRLALLRPFHPTDVGIFHSASGHERRRPAGSSQTIFIHCIAGGGWCEVEGARHAVGPGSLLVIPARCAHAYGASTRSPWSIEWFHATGAGIPEILRRMGTNRRSPVLSLGPGVWDSGLFEEALSGLEAGFTDSHLVHAALALGHLLGRIIVRQKEGFPDRSSLAARLEKVAVFLRENHAQSPGVPAMASMAGLSPSHFAGLFLRHTGHPPVEYLIRARIGRACQLLDFTDLPIKEIAQKVGYPDPYYFSRIFKKVTASSPGAYRRTSKG